MELPVLPTPVECRLHISGSIRQHGQVKWGTRIKVPHQHIVLGDRDVVGMHGKPDALLHLRGESPRLTGALAPLLPRAPEQMGREMDRVKMQPGLNSEDIGGAITSDRMSALYPLGLHRWESLRNHP